MDKASSLDPTSLVQKLNEIIQQMHADGTLTALSMKWYRTDLTVQQEPDARTVAHQVERS